MDQELDRHVTDFRFRHEVGGVQEEDCYLFPSGLPGRFPLSGRGIPDPGIGLAPRGCKNKCGRKSEDWLHYLLVVFLLAIAFLALFCIHVFALE